MISRVLPSAEWPRLVGTELESVWPYLSPQSATVFVVEEDGLIIGCWASILIPHAEGVWIAPSHRMKAAVAKLLTQAMRAHVLRLGARTMYTSSCTAVVTRLLRHLKAVKLPGDHFIVSVEEL